MVGETQRSAGTRQSGINLEGVVPHYRRDRADRPLGKARSKRKGARGTIAAQGISTTKETLR